MRACVRVGVAGVRGGSSCVCALCVCCLRVACAPLVLGLGAKNVILHFAPAPPRRAAQKGLGYFYRFGMNIWRAFYAHYEQRPFYRPARIFHDMRNILYIVRKQLWLWQCQWRLTCSFAIASYTHELELEQSRVFGNSQRRACLAPSQRQVCSPSAGWSV